MGFSKKIKLEAKRRAAFRCCLCHHLFVEVHHIVPAAVGGSDTLDNAAPLCASCHDLYGGNPEKRKQIRELRDEWWIWISERRKAFTTETELDDVAAIDTDPEYKGNLRGNSVRMYHRILPNDTFDAMAQALWGLVVNAQKLNPGWPRHLYLDIDGHRTTTGAFDHDTWEIQRHFIIGNLMPFIRRAHMPLTAVENRRAQRNILPDELRVYADSDMADMIADIGNSEIYVADVDKLIRVSSGS